ncbi:MAG: DUF732 domain-containing protein [Mycobacterium sp.]
MKRLLMLVSVAAMTAMAAPAYADPDTDSPPGNDAHFLKQLSNAGVTYKDPASAVSVAKDVCDLAAKGTPATDIKKDLETRNFFSGNGATNFMMLAAAEYCPKQLPDDGSPPKSPVKEGS